MSLRARNVYVTALSSEVSHIYKQPFPKGMQVEPEGKKPSVRVVFVQSALKQVLAGWAALFLIYK